jgi:hypothetical protein
MNTWSTPGSDANRRRSQRVVISTPVVITGEGAQGPFTEKTQTLVINAHGALITLTARVSNGQSLQMHTDSHPEKQACRVVYVGPTVDGKTQLGVEFSQSAPHFWHIAFPPEGWTPPLMEESEKPEKPARPSDKSANR